MKYIIIMVLLSGCSDKLTSINLNANAHYYTNNPCQKYVDAKYKELIKQGYQDKDIKFVITSDKGRSHVVLNVDGMILDNLYDDPYPATKELSNGLDYHHWNSYRRG